MFDRVSDYFLDYSGLVEKIQTNGLYALKNEDGDEFHTELVISELLSKVSKKINKRTSHNVEHSDCPSLEKVLLIEPLFKIRNKKKTA